MRQRIGRAAGRVFHALHTRNFRLFFVGQLISQIGTWLTQIALTLLVLHRGGSGIAIGILVACQFGPVLALGAYGGLVADRADKRRLLLRTQTLQMLQSFALGALAFWSGAPLAAFYATAFAGGVLLAFDNPARRSFVPEMVPEDEMQNAVTLNSALMTSSRIFGPALAGLLVVTAGYGWAFTLDAITYLAVLAGLWMMRPAELHPTPRTERRKGQVREGLRYVRTVPDLWIPMVVMTIVGTFTFNFSVVLPLFVERTLHGTDGTYTVLYSVLSVGSFVAALTAAYRRTVGVGTVVTATFVFGAAMCLFATAPDLALAYPGALFLGFGSILFMTAGTTIVQVRSDPNMRGRVVALQATVMLGTTPLGGPLLGAVCDAFGARAGVVLGGVAALAAAVWGRAVSRRPGSGRGAPAVGISGGAGVPAA